MKTTNKVNALLTVYDLSKLLRNNSYQLICCGFYVNIVVYYRYYFSKSKLKIWLSYFSAYSLSEFLCSLESIEIYKTFIAHWSSCGKCSNTKETVKVQVQFTKLIETDFLDLNVLFPLRTFVHSKYLPPHTILDHLLYISPPLGFYFNFLIHRPLIFGLCHVLLPRSSTLRACQ